MRSQWFRLDNAALIFPAVMRRNWNNAFRLSVTLTEQVDRQVLYRAAESLRGRFPSFFVRLRTGFFWYCLERTETAPEVREDFAYPLAHMSRRNCGKAACASSAMKTASPWSFSTPSRTAAAGLCS